MSEWHGGKGSGQRPTNRQRFAENYEAIFNKKATEESKQDPVAWMYEDAIYWEGCESLNTYIRQNGKPLYPYSPKRQPLSGEDIAALWGDEYSGQSEMIQNFARAIEKAHGIG